MGVVILPEVYDVVPEMVDGFVELVFDPAAGAQSVE